MMIRPAVVEKEDNAAESGVIQPLELTIDRALLLKALGHVQSVVERRNTIPILSNVKLEAFDGILSLTATDMDIDVTERVEAEISEEGALTVPAHTLYDIVRKLPDGAQVELKSEEGKGRMEIASGASNFSLPCLPASDFPVMDKGDMSHKFTLTAAELKALVDKPRFAISTEETRYYLNGIYFHSRDDKLCTVATDGHRLAKIEIDAPEGAEGIPGVIIPRKTVAEIKKLVDESDAEVEVSLSDTKICFVSGETVLLSKLIDGTFPEYDKVIPSGNDREMLVNTETLVKAVDRVSTISFEKTKAIKFVVSKGVLTLSAANDDSGTANEEIGVEYSSPEVEIGFNSRYILDMLSVIEGSDVEFVFADGAAPVLVKDRGDESALYVIMPMRI